MTNFYSTCYNFIPLLTNDVTPRKYETGNHWKIGLLHYLAEVLYDVINSIKKRKKEKKSFKFKFYPYKKEGGKTFFHVKGGGTFLGSS